MTIRKSLVVLMQDITQHILLVSQRSHELIEGGLFLGLVDMEYKSAMILKKMMWCFISLTE
ncbi:MAG: hypothetical protein IPM96_07945 [Ignavibacteria bacterium]|nr:hypothetical protein [Ignavibacteria bacterium]